MVYPVFLCLCLCVCVCVGVWLFVDSGPIHLLFVWVWTSVVLTVMACYRLWQYETMACYLLCEGLMLCRGVIYLSTDYSFASLCIMYVWLNLLRRVLRLKWLHALMFPLLNTASRPLSTCFRSNYFDFVFPCIRFRFTDRALPFPYPFPHKKYENESG